MANIVFDLDGTLVDSVPDIHAAVNKVLEGEGLQPLELATVKGFIGNGLGVLMERVMEARGISTTQFIRLYDEMRDFYNTSLADLTTCYPGVPEVLAALKDEGHALGVCTNKPEEPARLILNLLGIEAMFDVVIGGDSTGALKPDPAPLRAAFEALGEGERVYVGDSEVDAKAAQAASVRFLLFTEGYRRGPVDGIHHDVAFSDFADLPVALRVPA